VIPSSAVGVYCDLIHTTAHGTATEVWYKKNMPLELDVILL